MSHPPNVEPAGSGFDAFLSWVCRHYWIYVALCAAGLLTLSLCGTPFDRVLRDDALGYLLKARELTQGNWEPVHTHFIGWPMFLSVSLAVFRVEPVFAGMVLSRLLSILLTGLLVVPVALVAERAFDRRAGLFAVAAVAVSAPLVKMGSSAYTEPLFIPLTLFSLYFWIPDDRSRLTVGNVFMATILGSLAWYVRPNGAFLLIVGMASVLLWTKGRLRWTLLAIVPVLFVLVSLPHLIPRALHYGSPFDYGENSKLFAESYRQVFSPNVDVPSASEYFRTHSLREILDKFVSQGLLKQLRMLWSMVPFVWILGAAFGGAVALFRGHRPSLTVVICLGVFVAGFTPVFDVFGTKRHLLVLLPLIFILGGGFVSDVLTKRLASRRLSMIRWPALAALAIGSIATAPLYRLPRGIDLTEPVVRDEWAHWGARNLTGIIAIVEGDVLIELCLDEPLPAARRYEHDMFPLSFERPGDFATLDEAYRDFLARGYDYLFLDSDNVARRPYLTAVYESAWMDRFVLIREFRSTPEDRWELPDMDIFRIEGALHTQP